MYFLVKCRLMEELQDLVRQGIIDLIPRFNKISINEEKIILQEGKETHINENGKEWQVCGCFDTEIEAISFSKKYCSNLPCNTPYQRREVCQYKDVK